MTRLTAIALGVCLIGLGFAQSPLPLVNAKGVDIRTVWVNWCPSGDCLAYNRELDSGTAIGLYQVGAPQGALLLRLKKGEAWNLDWFSSQDAAIVTVTNSDTARKHVSVYLLEAKGSAATKLFDQSAPLADNLSVDSYLSPVLEHAVFAVHAGALTYHLVLPQGGTSLIPSTDLDEADHQGLIGPKWAASGTAFYLDRQSANAAQVNFHPNISSPQDQMLWALLGAEVDSLDKSASSGDQGRDQAEQAFTKSMIQSLKDRLTPAPPAGDSGWELAPLNGILRQVRSPGPWVESGPQGFDMAPQKQLADVTAGQLTGKSQSLWLISGDKRRSQLVAPSAQDSWLSPTGQAIAYTVDGVLFVRNLRP
jgi:hypothetical protein